jgi:delta8-fatty-acid desaturase
MMRGCGVGATKSRGYAVAAGIPTPSPERYEMGATLWTRDKVAERVLLGDTLVIYRGRVLRVPQQWLDAHPGGALAILHFVGRDASDEVDAFHGEAAMRKLRAYIVGDVAHADEPWAPLVPPVQSGWVRRIGPDGAQTWYSEAAAVRSMTDTEISPSSQILLVPRGVGLPAPHLSLDTLAPPPTELSLEVQVAHSAAYRALHEKITAAGLYECPYWTGYGPEVARWLLLAGLSAYAYRHGWFVTSAVFLGALWHQLVFTVHDLGHMGVTHNWVVDRFIGITLADFIGGVSVGWWVDVSLLFFSPNFISSCMYPTEPQHPPS